MRKILIIILHDFWLPLVHFINFISKIDTLLVTAGQTVAQSYATELEAGNWKRHP